MPDPKFGEELCAWIKVHEGRSLTEAEVRGYCDGRISHFKVPRYIRFVDDFPMTVTGKVQKFQMRNVVHAVSAWARPSSSTIASRIWNFCTLPVTVIGKSSTNRM